MILETIGLGLTVYGGYKVGQKVVHKVKDRKANKLRAKQMKVEATTAAPTTGLPTTI